MKDLGRKTLLICIWICCSLINHGAGSICIPTWTKYSNQVSIRGTQEHLNDLQSCLSLCQFTPNCVAVDFDPPASPPCWLHSDLTDLIPDNVYYSATASQYVINTTCAAITMSDCQLTWVRIADQHSIFGTGFDFWTEFDCFTVCRYTPDCVAADFDPEASPACWLHTSYDDLSYDNTYQDSTTAVQYRMNRTCPAPPQTDEIQLGQCVGYVLKSGAWCPDGKEIHVTGAWYKLHPLCCNSPGNENFIDVPDNPSLPQLNVFTQRDTDFIATIRACDGNTSCFVASKGLQSSDINNYFCPSRSQTSNYVSLSYRCLTAGHTEPSTTTSQSTSTQSNQGTHGVTLPGDGKTGTHGVTLPGDGKTANLSFWTPDPANSIQYQSSNRDALILGGFGVAFGGLALILVIIVIVWLYKRKDQFESNNNLAMNPMYGNGSVSGDSYDNGRYGNPMKGLSTAVIYPETDSTST